MGEPMRRYGFWRRRAALAFSRVFALLKSQGLPSSGSFVVPASRSCYLCGETRRRIDFAHDPAHGLAVVPCAGSAETVEDLVDDDIGDLAVEA